MKLISLYIDNFGKLSNFKYDFNDNLNCIYKENGWGKTTLSMFIKAMLYGLSSTSSSDLEKNDRKKYLPWNNLNCGGHLILEIENKLYKIERTFSKKSKDDTCVIYDLSTNKVTDKYDGNIGEQLLGLNVNSFERSVFIPQKELTAEFGNDISLKLSSLIGGMDDNYSYNNAIDSIEKNMKELKRTGNKGLIPEIKEQIKELDETIDACNNKINSIPSVLKEIEQIQEQIDIYATKKNEIKEKINVYNKTLEKINKLDTLKKYDEDIKLSNENLQSYKNILNNKELNSKDIIDCKNKYQQYITEKAKIKETLILDDTLKIFNESNKINDSKINDISNKIEKYYKKDEVKKPSVLRTIILPVFFSLIMIFSIIMLFVNEEFRKSGIGLILISISLISIVLSTSYRNRQTSKPDENLESQIREFFARYNMFDSNFKENLIELKHLSRKYDEFILGNEQIESTNKEKKLLCDSLLNDINSFLNEFNLERNEIHARINELERVVILYENEKANYNRLLSTKELFIKNNDLDNIKEDLSSYDIDSLSASQDELDKIIIDLNNKKQDRINLKNELEKQIDILEIQTSLKEKLVNDYQKYCGKYEIYSNTLKLLSSAQEKLMAKYVKPMKDSIKKYFDITLKEKDEFLLNIDFDLKFLENGLTKEISYYSKGYQQIVALCMRFALIDVLYENEKPFVVLDDPLVNFDEDKLKVVIDLLKDISKNLQIVYFTCHKSRII